MPGVTYTREVDFTSRGPDRPRRRDRAEAGRQRSTRSRRRSRTTCCAGTASSSRASTAEPRRRRDDRRDRRRLLRPQHRRAERHPHAGGVLESPPDRAARASASPRTARSRRRRVSFAGTGRGAASAARSRSTPGRPGKFTLYTPAYGGSDPAGVGESCEAVIGVVPAARLGQPLDGTVTQVTTSGPTPIPRGGAVLVARGARRPPSSRRRRRSGSRSRRLLSLSPDWSSLASAIGGGPLLVRNGKADLLTRASPSRPAPQQPPGARRDRPARRRAHRPRRCRGDESRLQHRHVELRARASSSPGSGRRPPSASAPGPPSGIAFDGTLLTRPSSRRSRRRSPTRSSSRTAASTRRLRRTLCSRRTATASATPRRSPTASSVRRTWSRRSAGPGGAKVTLAERGGVARAVHRSAGTGIAGGSPAPEGTWTFTVTGTDDRKVTTTRAADVLARRHALVARPHDATVTGSRRRRSS